uniref:Uncharacterized protein n=1 Tax=Arundo donax TaxID=35708 RepID=A0A0A9E1Y2_ARUDO
MFPVELCEGGGAVDDLTLELKAPNGSDPSKPFKGTAPNGSKGSGIAFLDTEVFTSEDVPELGGGINPVCGGNAASKVGFSAKRSTLPCTSGSAAVSVLVGANWKSASANRST